MSAIRLARGFTGRDTIVKFEGCYHGHSDSLLIKAGSGALTFGVPTSPGVPQALAAHTVTLDYNDAEQVREAFRQIGGEIACVIVEPVAGNMNCVPPAPGLPQDAARGMRSRRRAVDLRRGHDRLSRRPGRRAGTVRRAPGPHDARQDHRRRHAGGRVRRPARHHGAARALGPGLPGGHLVGQPGGHDGRPRHPGTDRGSRLSRAAERDAPMCWCGASPARPRSAGIALATNHVCGMFGFFFTGGARASTASPK